MDIYSRVCKFKNIFLQNALLLLIYQLNCDTIITLKFKV